MFKKNFRRFKKEINYIKKSAWTMDEVGRHWDKTTDYDDINEKTYSYFRRFTDAYKISRLKDKAYVLDICSRTGNGALYFWQKNKISRVVCADVTKKMQILCRKNLSQYPIDFQTQLFRDYPLPFSNEEFETILCFETLEHLPQPKYFIQELGRITKKDGQLILTTPNILWEPVHWLAAILNLHHSEGPHRFQRRKNIIKWLQSAGFKIISEKTTVLLPFGPKFLTQVVEKIEKALPELLKRSLALRRIFICEK